MLPLLLLALLPTARPLAAEADARPPTVGLVLSGGGARGLTHVGVLKVLEEARIPIDRVAGTSMGAIIGGLYASGMSASAIEAELLQVDWNKLFATRVSRQQLSQRRKEEDFEIPAAIELGWHDGSFHAPQAAISSRGLETLLRRYTLPVRQISRFDELPIPYRAVATNMENGDMVVLDRGDLAMALRSSMSVPGVFPSTEVDGQVLGDGGLVNNVPIDVARAMGAQRIIAVNIGTPLAPRETLNSAIGLTAQMINILTEQNVKRSLATLRPDDVLIAPDLGPLTSGDFDKAPELIALGEAAARALLPRLQPLALSEAEYRAWREARRPPAANSPRISEVAFEGTSVTNPSRLSPQLLSKPGQRFHAEAAAADARFLAASGDYIRADYHLIDAEDGDSSRLVFEVEDKPWGPNYLRVGLDLSTDLSGRSAFNIKLSHNRHWLTPSGTEWRNRLQIGEVPSFYTELYHPLGWHLGLWDDWFVSGWAYGERRLMSVYDGAGGPELGQVRQSAGAVGVDLGQPWGRLGELRLGLRDSGGRDTAVLLPGASDATLRWHEVAARARMVIDQLDFANFPQRGYRLTGELQVGQRSVGSERQHLVRVEADAHGVWTWGTHTLSLYGVAKATDSRSGSLAGQYGLGGFQNLSGYRYGQITGSAILFGRAGWYMRLSEPPVFARALFLGGTLELGNGWSDRRQMGLGGLRTGASLYLGADTGLGPAYVGITWAPQGEAGLALFIGRP